MSNRPKPTAMKKLLGNPDKRRINENEPQPRVGEPEMPELSGDAAKEWKRIVPILMSLGILTIADGPALAIYCDAFAFAQKAKKQLSRSRDLTSAKARRLFSMSEKSMKLAKSMLVEFGLTPASRPRLAGFCILPPTQEKDDPAEEYFSDIRPS
jgi:P27 family predicted phage terminase small subunit